MKKTPEYSGGYSPIKGKAETMKNGTMSDAELELEADAIAYLHEASPELQANKEVVLKAVKLDGNALHYASPELRADREVVLEAVKQNGEAIIFASVELSDDPEIKKAAGIE